MYSTDKYNYLHVPIYTYTHTQSIVIMSYYYCNVIGFPEESMNKAMTVLDLNDIQVLT